MLQLTNPQQTFAFLVFIQESLQYVSAKTPTKINSGGCGQFAKILYLKLQELGFQPSIKGLFNPHDEDDMKLKTYLHELKQGKLGNLSNSGASHVFITINGLNIDSDGIMHDIPDNIAEEIPFEVLDEVVQQGKWNPMFDKGCLPLIQQLMDETFSSYASGNWTPHQFTLSDDFSIRYSNYTIEQMKKQSKGGHILAGLSSLFE